MKSHEHAEDAPAEAKEALIWQVRLYQHEPGKRLTVLLAAAIAGWLGFILLNNLIVALIGFAAILAATAEFWLPLHYKLDENRASVRCGFSVTAIEWSDVKRIVMASDGWKLSPLSMEGRLSPFRGVFVRFDGNGDAVTAIIRQRVQENVRYVEHGTDGGGGGETSSEGGERDQTSENGSGGDSGARSA